ncbi:hypothetical protein A8P30_04030 [Treponema pallidum subsp. pallidum]|nr:hypothetical protein A8P30_04030 [Treponema pallidum subsp. pallidum]AOF63410.1 hypothetical protein A8P31_04040 [Treponema pallidum subsp. pallidum]AOF65303.1 hypothetical protein A8P32_04045 [Treponema pallidum subsp. pallidum]
MVLWSEECSEHTQILHRISLEAVLFHGYLHASVLIFVTAKKNTKDKDMPAPRTQTRAVPGLKTRLLNYNAFTSTGELALRGEGVTPGYWRDEVRTRAAFTPDGWLRTGTLWTKTETGNLLPCSSSCHMQLGARGEAVYAEDLVCVLMQHPCVVHAHVRGARTRARRHARASALRRMGKTRSRTNTAPSDSVLFAHPAFHAGARGDASGDGV